MFSLAIGSGNNLFAAKEVRQLAGRRRKICGGVALLLVMAALYWQWNQSHKQRGMGNAFSGVNSAAAISGVWQGGRL
ncbi:MAG TPA: hypothetical protein VFW91_08835 [Candidatus Binatia bacterium]|nr:hypothetical protein [Candidatus Binatia bacterium]